MYQLKGAIFSLRDVLLVQGQLDEVRLRETILLLKYLLSIGVQPVLVSNARWTINGTMDAQSFLSGHIGATLPYFQGGRDMAYKQKPEAMAHVLKQFGWRPEEAVYIGSTEDDMRAARNGGLLFLNAQWHAQNSEYGFQFESPLDIARSIDCCCIGLGDWFWAVQSGQLRVYTIAPFAQYSPAYPDAKNYSSDAKNAVKFSRGAIPFWGRLMAARLYFAGLATEANYLAPYPGHRPNSSKSVLTHALRIVSGSLRAQYLDDLIVRHNQAQKSQAARNAGKVLSHANQLDTIHLRPDPVRTGPARKRYVRPPNLSGKTVIVVDDICTEGHSMEAARMFLQAAGANVVSVAWLKTPGNNHYKCITDLQPPIKKPFVPYQASSVKQKQYTFSGNIHNNNASKEVAQAFARYNAWSWPKL